MKSLLNNISSRINLPFAIWMIVMVSAGVVVLADYLGHRSLNLWLGLLLFPFIARPIKTEKSKRYVWPALLCVGLYLLMPAKTVLYVGWVFALLFLIESFLGKTSLSAFFTVLLAGALANYVFKLFGFEIRLVLTELSAQLLNLIYSGSYAAGNTIHMNNEVFSVDPACMGLNMVISSFYVMLFFISWFEYKQQKQLGWVAFGSLMFGTLFLIVLANFIRIIGLVLLHSEPDSFSHQFIGLACLVLYVLIPAYFLVKWLVKKRFTHGENKPYLSASIGFGLKGYLFSHLMSLFLVIGIAIGYFVNPEIMWSETYLEPSDISKYNFEKKKYNVHQWTRRDDQVLIYIKPPVPFFSADHNPTMCWVGSGYKLKNSRKMKRNDKKFYYAELDRVTKTDSADIEPKKETLYTAWWYDNSVTQNIGQLEWRIETIKGNGNFHLVNVTMEDREALFEWLDLHQSDFTLNPDSLAKITIGKTRRGLIKF